LSSGRVGVQIKNARNRGRTLNIRPINLHDVPSTTLTEGQEEGRKETPTQETKDEEDCPQEQEDNEDCPICTDALPKLSAQFTRYTCCGEGLHNKCAKDLMKNTSITREQKNTKTRALCAEPSLLKEDRKKRLKDSVSLPLT
jgi:hypothetical protein